jgi:hypothetical protein
MASYATSNAVDRNAWVTVQKKTFTRWVNMHLKKRQLSVEDLFVDTRDGVAWCNLLEIIGGESIKAVTGNKFNKKPKFEIHMGENGNRVLEYCEKRELGLVNVGSGDLLRGNEKIILGFIWKIILRFVVSEEGQEGLLLWAQRACKNYSNIDIKNFHRSWKDGLGFVGIIHKHRPDLIADPSTLSQDDAAANCELAFKVAEEKLGIDRLLDAEDIVGNEKPDEKSIATYISQFYVLFAKQLQNEHYIQSILTAVAVTRRHDELIEKYNVESSGLHNWVTEKTADINKKQENIGNNTEAVRAELKSFYAYRQNEKPARQGEMIEIEGILGSLLSSSKSNNRPLFEPSGGLDPESIHAEFSNLDQAERGYEGKLREKLITYMRIDFIVRKFTSRGEQLNNWCAGSISAMDADDFGTGVAGAETSAAKHSIFEDQLEKYRAVLSEMESMKNDCANVPDHADSNGVVSKFDEFKSAVDSVIVRGNEHSKKIQEQLEMEKRLADLKSQSAKASALAQYDGDKIVDDISDPVIKGSTQAIDEKLEKLNGPITNSINTLKSDLEKLQALVTEISGNGGSADLNDKTKAMLSDGYIDSLNQQVADEVASVTAKKQTEDDKEERRRKFADIANNVSKSCEDKSKVIKDLSNAGGEPQEQMDKLEELSTAHVNDTIMQDAEAASTACDEAGILINTYTDETIFSLRATWKAVTDAYKQAKNVCEMLIMDQKGSKLTAEQIKEVREVFDYFDQDKDNTLDFKEFKDACQGIGLIMDDDEVQSLYLKLSGGSNKRMNFEGFSDFMYGQLKTGASLEDVMNAFSNLAGGADVLTEDAITQHFSPHGDVADYLKENMSDGAYKPFTTQLFTR